MKLKEKKLSMKTNKNHIVNDQIGNKKNNLKKKEKKGLCMQAWWSTVLGKKRGKKDPNTWA